MFENQVKKVFLGVGSNLGNRQKNIELSKIALTNSGIKILKSSSFYESLSWPDPKKPKFLNIVLEIETTIHPVSLLKICKKIEKSLGREISTINSPRICDIDILDYGNKVMNNGINLPHPRMHQRNFVLIPLFEIRKKWLHTKSKDHIKTLILKLSNKDITSIKQI